MTETRQTETGNAANEADMARIEGQVPAEQQPDPVAEAQLEAAGYKDKLLRTLAEMENLRKRTEREVADARSYGIAAFARDMLDVADNMRRALDAVPAEARTAGDAGLTALIEGVELTERALIKALEKNGVRKFDPSGEKFNPNLHQAMYEVPDPAVPAGAVAHVVQAGFMLGERMLRPALVGVSKGAVKSAPAGNADDDDE
ncbi:MAG: nucleotide exchange factor GrpE [Xanthobacteraceae bacterium]|nr:MAG: nucleotide exchange factor GrpE [Xanthobacteraceae bacterium]